MNAMITPEFKPRTVFLRGPGGDLVPVSLEFYCQSGTELGWDLIEQYKFRLKGSSVGNTSIRYHSLPNIYTGKMMAFIEWAGKEPSYRMLKGIGVHSVALAIERSRQRTLDERVGLEACYGSGETWLRIGFEPILPREEFLEAAKWDGGFGAYAFLPKANVGRVEKLISENFQKR